MMTKNDEDRAGAQRLTRSPAIKSLLVAAVAVCSAAALAGCEERSYPTPSVAEAPPPPPPPAPLMGAPTPPTYPPCADTPCGPQSPANQPMMAPHIIASTPVPNPPETEHRRHRIHTRYWTYGEAHPASSHHYLSPSRSDGRWHVVAPASTYHTHRYAASAPGAAPTPVTPPHRHLAAAPHAVAPHIAATPPAASVARAVGNTTAGGRSGADVERYNGLQAALSSLIGSDAVLATPDHFDADQTVDVTLTLPANFAQQTHDEAIRVGLADAAASVNIDARLTGSGFTVTPEQSQAQPLLLGQPTIFRWKVTPTSVAMGPVKADISADLLTVGHALPLGSVQSQAGVNSFRLSGRVIGVGILILLLLIVAGWIAVRRGKGPAFRRKDI